LAGGLTAINNEGLRVALSAGRNSPILAEFPISRYALLFAQLASLKLRVIGCQFFQDMDEVAGIRPAEFRALADREGWVVNEARQLWRQVATNAMQEDRMDIAENAARIGFELEAVEYRLLELCQSYETQLRALAIKHVLEEYKRFDDLNSGRVIHAIHALFYEVAVLRDYIAEFVSRFIFQMTKANGEPITAMSELSSMLKRASSDDPLVREIQRITARETRGWLAELSAYRNLFTHVAPIEMFTTRSFAVQEFLSVEGAGRLPVLYHPLPPNILEGLHSRKKGFPFTTFESWAKASACHMPKRSGQPDALEYLHAAANNMGQFAKGLVARSPVAPKMLHFGPDDIIGPITVTTS